MRFVSLLALCLATPLAAQIPDPTPPADYFPLHVGNVWEYAQCRMDPSAPDCADGRIRRTIVRDTTVNGTSYVVETTEPLTEWADVWWSRRLLRFDAATATVRRLDDDGTEAHATCRLDADFWTNTKCYNHTPYVYPDTTNNFKVYYFGSKISEYFLSGIGWYGHSNIYERDYLTFALVNGQVVYGQPYVDVEVPASAAALALTVAPTPTAGPVTLTVTATASPADVEVFDALGRRVWRGSVAGETTVDASGWAPGVYVVRATAGGATTVSRFVRR